MNSENDILSVDISDKVCKWGYLEFYLLVHNCVSSFQGNKKIFRGFRPFVLDEQLLYKKWQNGNVVVRLGATPGYVTIVFYANQNLKKI